MKKDNKNEIMISLLSYKRMVNVVLFVWLYSGCACNTV